MDCAHRGSRETGATEAPVSNLTIESKVVWRHFDFAPGAGKLGNYAAVALMCCRSTRRLPHCSASPLVEGLWAELGWRGQNDRISGRVVLKKDDIFLWSCA